MSERITRARFREMNAPDFAAASAVFPIAPLRYAVEIRSEWFGGAGPSGGYLASMLLRAMIAEVADTVRLPRMLSCQFLAVAHPGPAAVTLTIIRAGRRMTFMRADLEQHDRRCVTSTAIFASPQESLISYSDATSPAIPCPADLPELDLGTEAPSVFERLEMRPGFGDPLYSGGSAALTGGWIRFRSPCPLDAAALCFFADCWMPSLATRLRFPPTTPTIDYSIYFRHQAEPELGQYVMLRTSSQCSLDGFFEEDGMIWSSGGVLLAQSRQLGLAR